VRGRCEALEARPKTPGRFWIEEVFKSGLEARVADVVTTRPLSVTVANPRIARRGVFTWRECP
jgi:hypothetical protein